MNLRVLPILVVLGVLAGCGESTTPVPNETLAVFNAAGAPTVDFNMPDMMCEEGCAAKVRELLSEQPGVAEVNVDFAGKTATVAVEENGFDAEAAVAVLVDHGFENSALKSAAAN